MRAAALVALSSVACTPTPSNGSDATTDVPRCGITTGPRETITVPGLLGALRDVTGDGKDDFDGDGLTDLVIGEQVIRCAREP